MSRKKLTDYEVREIRHLYEHKAYSAERISKAYPKVSPGTVWKVCNRITYKNVEDTFKASAKPPDPPSG